ncbi:MAG: Nif3-like dinuclear metal center hexameric protein [Eubacteriales bacterium]|nr:Nif3-like dinuclear metal center hexameric protein [Eubacteriales bacterium]MDD4389493.1 Nif3-like dinuclear metal center hexameric protein [Eubacteriales bacterium]
MIKETKLISILNEIAPPELAEAWDNCGFQIRTGKEDYSKILICLEITNAIIEQAKSLDADIIITHHPLLFSPIKNVDSRNVVGNYVIELIRNDISVFSLHTNFDKAQQGNNTYMAKLLDLQNIEFMRTGSGPYDYMGCTGEFRQEITVKDVISKICSALEIKESDIRCVTNDHGHIKKIALCTGAGAEFIDIMPQLGCSLYITGDVKYHDAQKAKELSISLIDAGHYGTEAIFVDNLCEQLKMRIGTETRIIASKLNINPFSNINQRS